MKAVPPSQFSPGLERYPSFLGLGAPLGANAPRRDLEVGGRVSREKERSHADVPAGAGEGISSPPRGSRNTFRQTTGHRIDLWKGLRRCSPRCEMCPRLVRGAKWPLRRPPLRGKGGRLRFLPIFCRRTLCCLLVRILFGCELTRSRRQKALRRPPLRGKGGRLRSIACTMTLNPSLLVGSHPFRMRTRLVPVYKRRFVARPLRGEGGRLRYFAWIVTLNASVLVWFASFVDAN